MVLMTSNDRPKHFFLRIFLGRRKIRRNFDPPKYWFAEKVQFAKFLIRKNFQVCYDKNFIFANKFDKS